MAGGRMDERRANVSFSPLPSLNRWFSLPPHDFGSGSVGRSASPLCSASRSVCGALEASAHNVVIKLPRDHFDLRLNKGGSSSSHREGGREKRSQFVPPFLPPLASLSLSYSASPHCRSRMFSRTRIQTSAGGGRARRRRAHFAYCRSLPSVFEATPGAASLPPSSPKR